LNEDANEADVSMASTVFQAATRKENLRFWENEFDAIGYVGLQKSDFGVEWKMKLSS